MKIGIDAKWFFDGPPSGVNVVRNLVKSLITENDNNELYIFLNSQSRIKKHLLPSNSKNVFYIFIPSKLNIVTNLFYFPIYFYKLNLDVVLFQNYVPLYKLGKTKYINYVHDLLFLDYPHFFSKIELFLYKFILLSIKISDFVLTISQTERNRILKYSNINENKISFIYHGVDFIFKKMSFLSREQILVKHKLPEKYILYVGRINIRKNIIALLKCLPHLIMNFDVSLVIVGKEENNDINITEVIKEMGIEKSVFILGHLPDNELSEIYSASSLFVFPSYAEGFGLPPLEAMQSGIPTIVSRIQPFIELFGNSVLYFNPKNHFELQNKIAYILVNQKLRDRYITRGIEKANSYSWNKSAIQFFNIIKYNFH